MSVENNRAVRDFLRQLSDTTLIADDFLSLL